MTRAVLVTRAPAVCAESDVLLRSACGPHRCCGWRRRTTPRDGARSAAYSSTLRASHAPSAYEVMFVSLAHDDQAIDHTVAAFGDAVKSALN